MKYTLLTEKLTKYEEYKKKDKEKFLNKRKEYLKNFLEEMYKRDLLYKVWSKKLPEKETKEYKKKIKQMVRYASNEIIDLFSKRFELKPSKKKPRIVITRKEDNSCYDPVGNKIILSIKNIFLDDLSLFRVLGEECGHYFHFNIKKSKGSGFYDKTREYIGMLCSLFTINEFLPNNLKYFIEDYEYQYKSLHLDRIHDVAYKTALRDFREGLTNEKVSTIIKYFGKAIGAEKELKKTLYEKIKTIEESKRYKKDKEKVEKVAQEIADIYGSMKLPKDKGGLSLEEARKKIIKLLKK